MKNDALKTIQGEPSFRIANREVEAYVTRRGGHLAPAFFDLGRRRVQPYALAPWLPGDLPRGMPPILRVLRGDFFCLPFGASPGVRDVHGETANDAWRAVERGPDRLVLA